jgi:hypothetical protein
MPSSAASMPTHRDGELIEIAPGRWRLARPSRPPARSDLPSPMIIRDEMEPTEQVDGRFYTSKAKFRAVGRALGLIEVGNEKPRQKVRATASAANKRARRLAFQRAAAQHRAGRRPRQGGQSNG